VLIGWLKEVVVLYDLAIPIPVVIDVVPFTTKPFVVAIGLIIKGKV
jgi:hypothetical protein